MGCIWRERPHEEQRGELDEVIREHASTDNPIVVVREVERRDRGPWTETVDNDLVEATERTRVGVPLQAVAHPVVAEPANHEQPRGLHGTTGEHDASRSNRATRTLLHDVDLAGIGDPHYLRHRPQLGAICDGVRKRGRIGSVLGVDRTGEPDAEATTNARGSTVTRLRVDHQRYARRRPPERAGGGTET